MKQKAFYLLAAVTMLIPACRQEEILQDDMTGQETLTALMEDITPGTRTSYDGYYSIGNFAWTDGDQIAIHLKNGKYDIVDIIPDATDVKLAKFIYSKTSTTVRDYYAIYPASAAKASDYGNPTLKVTLPVEYDIKDNLVSDFSPVPMVADNTVNNPAPGKTHLEFYHVGGLLRITVTGVKEGTKVVKVTFPGKKVTGDFTVTKDAETDMLMISTADATSGNSVKFTVADDETTLGTSSTMVLNVPVPCGSYESVKLETFSSSDATEATSSETRTFDVAPLKFERHHGKKLAFGSLIFNFTLSAISPVTLSNEGGKAVLSDNFVSYKTLDGSTEKEAVPFQFEFSSDGTDWTDGLPEWLIDTSSDSGSTEGTELALTMKAQQNTVEEDEHTTELKSRVPQEDFDLSTYNVALDQLVGRTTSNCYVVQAPGTYKFPLVYGNGIVGGGTNYSAFRAIAGPGGTYRPDDGTTDFLGSYRDHLDNKIYNGGDAKSTPYIADHLSKTAAEIIPVLIWTDSPNLIEATSLSVSGSGAETYLHFKVPAERICQGNAVIGIRINGKIAWSWHIWVTDHKLSRDEAREGSNGYQFPPYNLGWCDAKMLEKYEERSFYIRLAQTIPGGKVSEPVKITQRGKTVSGSGYSPYYQWGRKDPLEPGIINTVTEGSQTTRTMVNKVLYDQLGSTYEPSDINGIHGAVSLGVAIQNPLKHFYQIFEDREEYGNWCDTGYYNLWNSVANGYGDGALETPITKTIYDPCPVGYKMGPQCAWGGFTEENFVVDTPFTGRSYNGLFFQACGRRVFNGPDLLDVVASPDESWYWTSGRYWTGTPGGRYSGIDAVFDYGGMVMDNHSARSMGFTVRPVLE